MSIATHRAEYTGIETAAHRERDGWHAIGKALPANCSAHEALEIAGLNWKVEKRPVFISDETPLLQSPVVHAIPNKFALVRNTDQKPFDIVGPHWRPTQNEEVAEFFRGFVDAGDLEPYAAGATAGGQNVFFIAKARGSFTFLGQDKTEQLLCFQNPHKNGLCVSIRSLGSRIWCANQIPLDIGSARAVRFTHVSRRRFNVEIAREVIKRSVDSFRRYEADANRLAGGRANAVQLEAYLRRVFGLEHAPEGTDVEEAKKINARRDRQFERVLDAHHTQPGVQFGKGTWWHAVNTVTYCIDHVVGRGSEDARFHGAQFGKGNERKYEALKLALTHVK